MPVPSFYICVVSTGQNCRYTLPPKFGGSCIVWPFKKAGHAVRKTVMLGARLVTQHAGQQSSHSINDRQGSDFTSTEYKVANTEFIRNQLCTNPFVDTFISSTHDRQTAMGAQFRGDGLIEAAALGRKKDNRGGLWQSRRLGRIPSGQIEMGRLPR